MEPNRLHIIVKGCARGDSSAQMELYNHFAQRIFNASLRVVRQSDEAEEITHDSFIKLFDRIASFVGREATIYAWLRRVAVNASIDAIRRRAKLSIVDCEQLPDMEEDESVEYPSPRVVHRVIDSLPEGYRLVMVLKLIEGLSSAEIGERLQISPTTVRSQFMRARQRVIQELKAVSYEGS